MATLINNIDINARGIYLARRGARELFTLPDLTKVETNDWQEGEGLQVDFTTVQRKSPEVVVHYVVTSQSAVTLLDSYHKAESIRITPHGWGRTFTLRRPQVDACKVHGKTAGDTIIEISYRYELDDLPTTGVTARVEPSDIATRFAIGGTPTTAYGVVINESDALYAPNDYKAATFVRKAKEVRMQCTMIANTWQGLWANRAALWTNLQGEMALTTPTIQLKARYLSCSDVRQVTTTQPVISFTLNLQLI